MSTTIMTSNNHSEVPQFRSCSSLSTEYSDVECNEEVKQIESGINVIQKTTSSINTESLISQEMLESGSSNNSRVIASDTFTTQELIKEPAVGDLTPTVTKNTLSIIPSVESGLLQNQIWLSRKKHIFILSEAGKPIYSLCGSEDKLAILFGIIQALVSFVENTQDVLTSIHARGIQFVFMIKSNLILVAASRTKMSDKQLQMQLDDVHNQILSTLTFTQLSKIFEHRKNFDLRRLLEGSERLINNLLINDSSSKKVTNIVFTFLTNSIRCLPMSSSTRSNIISAIKDNCSKIKNLVFAVLIANNHLICLVRMKKYAMNQSDLRLIFNLIHSTESFKASENWTPICLPKFNKNGYLHAHVSYLEDKCPACLLLLSVDRDDFFTLSNAKKSIVEKMERSQCLDAINESLEHLNNPKYRLSAQSIGIDQLRHFIYKPKSTAQVLCSEILPPYTSLQDFERLEGIYCNLLEKVHHSARPLKLIYEAQSTEVILAWSTATYELYAVFEPLVKKSVIIKNVDKLIKWIDKEFDTYFIRTHPTF